MDRFDRIYRLHGILNNQRTSISLKLIMERLECSKSTADRDIETLRDYLNAPLEYNRESNGYFYNQKTNCRIFCTLHTAFLPEKQSILQYSSLARRVLTGSQMNTGTLSNKVKCWIILFKQQIKQVNR